MKTCFTSVRTSSLPARSALSFRKSTYPRTIVCRFCWSRRSWRASLAAASPLMSAGLRSRSAATTASPPAAYTFGASGTSADSASESVRSSGIGGRPGSVAVCRSKYPVSSALSPASSAAFSSPVSLARASRASARVRAAASARSRRASAVTRSRTSSSGGRCASVRSKGATR